MKRRKGTAAMTSARRKEIASKGGKAKARRQQWQYIEPGEQDGWVTTHTFTEDEILRIYYQYWAEGMLRIGKSPLITEQNCIDDWVVVHWASKVKE